MPRKTQFTADDIVTTALGMVRKSGWAELSATAVAKQMGCSTMPIYSYFDNLEKLKDEVIINAWKRIMEYEAREYTGDIWVDQSIGYVFFARAETQLFMCMFDGRNVELQRKMLLAHWQYLAKFLDDYEGFKSLSGPQRLIIRQSRALMTHGLAVSVSTGWTTIMSDDAIIMNYIRAASHALLEGYQDLYARGDGVMQYVDKRIDDFLKEWATANQ